MGNQPHYSVATLGFEDRERRVLRNVLAISAHHVPAFRPFAASPGALPSVVVVNADSAEALKSWNGFSARHASQAPMAPVFLSRAPVDGVGPYVLHRPILASRLFQLLEQVVSEVHGFVAPLAIADEDPLVVLDTAAPAPVKSATMAASASGAASTSGAITMTSKAPVLDATAVRRGAPSELVALVVDDSLPVRIQMKTALQSLATHVDFAETGEQALDLIEKRSYTAVFLDVILPGKDGYEICRRIKKHPRQQRAQVVMLTGNSSPADRVKGKLAGCDTYLIKPVRQSVFEQLVASITRTTVAA